MKNNPLPRLDERPDLREMLLPHCRLGRGEIWADPVSGHKIGCLDAANSQEVSKLMDGDGASLAIHDPPYNLVAFQERSVGEFIAWCTIWVKNTLDWMTSDASFYVWLGADQRNGFQPLPDFMMMMRGFDIKTRSYITMRNQRGYGTQKNWMAVRQELLYYTKGNPVFNVEAEYTDIPKILRGYYKEINGKVTDNFERSKSENIRAGNVWVDIQQVFYRMAENVSGCYAQKPMKCIDRIVRASSNPGQLVVDFFAHSGTTLLACEVLKRRCYTVDIDPVFCEIAIRRLEHYRTTGELGWQNGHAFEDEIDTQFELPQEKEKQDLAIPTNGTKNLRHTRHSKVEQIAQPALL
jgi:DNA modification methylase